MEERKSSTESQASVEQSRVNVNIVNHTCIVCSSVFKQNRKTSHAMKTNSKSTIIIGNNIEITDEFSISFVLEKCLGLSVNKCEAMFTDLQKFSGKQGYWGISFCPKHAEMIENAQKKHNTILKLQRELHKDKERIKSEITSNLKGNTVMESQLPPYDGFRRIRESLRKALLPDSSLEMDTKKETSKPKLKTNEQSARDINEICTVNQAGGPEENANVKNSKETEIIDLTIEDDKHDRWTNVCQPNTHNDHNFTNENGGFSENLPCIVVDNVSSRTEKRINIGNLEERGEILKTPAPISSYERSDKLMSTRKSFKCRVCEFRFSIATERDEHQANIHGHKRFEPHGTKRPFDQSQKEQHSAKALALLRCSQCQEEYCPYSLHKCSVNNNRKPSSQLLKSAKHFTVEDSQKNRSFQKPSSSIGTYSDIPNFSQLCRSEKEKYGWNWKSNQTSETVITKPAGKQYNYVFNQPKPTECYSCGEEFVSNWQFKKHRYECGQFSCL